MQEVPASHLPLPLPPTAVARGCEFTATGLAGCRGRSMVAEEITVMGTGGGTALGKIAASESGLNLRYSNLTWQCSGPATVRGTGKLNSAESLAPGRITRLSRAPTASQRAW